jgi:hypothetical protein
MEYKAYGNRNGEENLLVVGSAKSKKEMRKRILTHWALRVFSRVEYGKKSYSLSDVYAGR